MSGSTGIAIPLIRFYANGGEGACDGIVSVINRALLARSVVMSFPLF